MMGKVKDDGAVTMFYKECTAYARKLGREAALAYSAMGQADPVSAMDWLSDRCQKASEMERVQPGVYAEFIKALNAARGAR